MALDPVMVALVGTVCGGIGLKVVEHWLGRNKVRSDDATQIRDELRQEITVQKAEIKQLEEDAVKWREEYFKLYEKYIADATESKIAIEKIKNELTSLQAGNINLVRHSPPALPDLPGAGS